MQTWEELKKERNEIISKEFAAAAREEGMQVAAPTNTSSPALPTNKFPGIDVGQIRVNTNTEQEFKPPSMGQVPVGGGYMALTNAVPVSEHRHLRPLLTIRDI